MRQMKFNIESSGWWFGKLGGKICQLPPSIETPKSKMVKLFKSYCQNIMKLAFWNLASLLVVCWLMHFYCVLKLTD